MKSSIWTGSQKLPLLDKQQNPLIKYLNLNVHNLIATKNQYNTISTIQKPSIRTSSQKLLLLHER